jgi:hypothetical protein
MRNGSITRSFAATVLSTVLVACTGMDRDGTTEAASGQTPVQFSDIPVPDGMTLQQDLNQSHSYEYGQFRVADLHYYGKLPVAEIAEYLEARMPKHGWVLSGAQRGTPAELTFTRGRQRVRCRIEVDSISVTRMHVEVRPIGASETP